MGELNPPPPQETASLGRMLGRAMLLRCPRCGGRDVIPSWFTMVEACPTCTHRFERRPEEGFFLGAISINIVITEGLLLIGVFVYIAVLAAGGSSGVSWPFLGGAAVAMVAAPAVFYPFSRTLWAAFEIGLHQMGEDGRW